MLVCFVIWLSDNVPKFYGSIRTGGEDIGSKLTKGIDSSRVARQSQPFRCKVLTALVFPLCWHGPELHLPILGSSQKMVTVELDDISDGWFVSRHLRVYLVLEAYDAQLPIRFSIYNLLCLILAWLNEGKNPIWRKVQRVTFFWVHWASAPNINCSTSTRHKIVGIEPNQFFNALEGLINCLRIEQCASPALFCHAQNIILSILWLFCFGFNKWN